MTPEISTLFYDHREQKFDVDFNDSFTIFKLNEIDMNFLGALKTHSLEYESKTFLIQLECNMNECLI